jgi:hypothetical protein
LNLICPMNPPTASKNASEIGVFVF